jgi:hypothetical protein
VYYYLQFLEFSIGLFSWRFLLFSWNFSDHTGRTAVQVIPIDCLENKFKKNSHYFDSKNCSIRFKNSEGNRLA